MRTPSVTAKAAIVNSRFMVRLQQLRRARAGQRSRVRCGRVRDVRDLTDPGGGGVLQGFLDDHGDRLEWQASVQKRFDRNFVGSVQCDWRGTARPQRVVGERQAREAAAVGRLEGQAAAWTEVEARGAASRCAPGSQRIGDGRRMSGLPSLRDDGAVAILDHRVDDALRVDHDIDRARPRTPNSQWPRSLRGPCSSWWPSRPRSCGPSPSSDARRPAPASRHRARCGVRGTARRTRSASCGARRAAGSAARRQALEDRVVLAVDRQQLRTALAHGLHEAAARASRSLPCSPAARACRGAPPPASAADRRRRRSPP